MPFDSESLRNSLILRYQQIHKTQIGMELSQIQTEFKDKLVVVKGKISLTGEELKYLNSKAGKNLIRQVRLGLLEEARPLINAQISSLTGCIVHSSLAEIDLDDRILQHTFVLKDVI